MAFLCNEQEEKRRLAVQYDCLFLITAALSGTICAVTGHEVLNIPAECSSLSGRMFQPFRTKVPMIPDAGIRTPIKNDPCTAAAVRGSQSCSKPFCRLK